MFKTFANAWKLTDLRKKILFTFLIIVLYRVGVAIPIPYLNPAMLGEIAKMAEGSIFQYLNILSGNAFSQATLFALGVSPYITSSIVMQLLTIAIPALERLAKEGQDGQKVINKIIIFGAVYLAIVALLPILSSAIFTANNINVGSLAIGGTSVIIVVGVALETVKALEAQMLMRHYKGYLD